MKSISISKTYTIKRIELPPIAFYFPIRHTVTTQEEKGHCNEPLGPRFESRVLPLVQSKVNIGEVYKFGLWENHALLLPGVSRGNLMQGGPIGLEIELIRFNERVNLETRG